jgi:hypothetical protein
MKRINKKKFYPCKQDYQDLEDCIVGISERLENIIKDPNTFMNIPKLFTYPDLPIVWTSTSGTDIKLVLD